MLAVKPTQMREQFKLLCDKVVKEREIIIVSRPNNENVVVTSEKEYNKLLREAKELDVLQFGMTNGSAIGYAMFALRRLGYSKEECRKIERRMYELMDIKTEEEAEKYYQEWELLD